MPADPLAWPRHCVDTLAGCQICSAAEQALRLHLCEQVAPRTGAAMAPQSAWKTVAGLGLALAVLAALLAAGSAPLADFIGAQVQKAVRQAVVWQPDSPKATAGEREHAGRRWAVLTSTHACPPAPCRRRLRWRLLVQHASPCACSRRSLPGGQPAAAAHVLQLLQHHKRGGGAPGRQAGAGEWAVGVGGWAVGCICLRRCMRKSGRTEIEGRPAQLAMEVGSALQQRNSCTVQWVPSVDAACFPRSPSLHAPHDTPRLPPPLLQQQEVGPYTFGKMRKLQSVQFINGDTSVRYHPYEYHLFEPHRCAALCCAALRCALLVCCGALHLHAAVLRAAECCPVV